MPVRTSFTSTHQHRHEYVDADPAAGRDEVTDQDDPPRRTGKR